MGRIIMSGIVPGLTKPVTGTPLSTYTEGSIIKINENSLPSTTKIDENGQVIE